MTEQFVCGLSVCRSGADSSHVVTQSPATHDVDDAPVRRLDLDGAPARGDDIGARDEALGVIRHDR